MVIDRSKAHSFKKFEEIVFIDTGENTCFSPFSVVRCSRPTSLTMTPSGQAGLESDFVHDVLRLKQAGLFDSDSSRSDVGNKDNYGEVARGA